MIEIKVNKNGNKIEVDAKVEIEGYKNAVEQFCAVIMAPDNSSEEVLVDAFEKFMEMKMEGDDDVKSES